MEVAAAEGLLANTAVGAKMVLRVLSFLEENKGTDILHQDSQNMQKYFGPLQDDRQLENEALHYPENRPLTFFDHVS